MMISIPASVRIASTFVKTTATTATSSGLWRFSKGYHVVAIRSCLDLPTASNEKRRCKSTSSARMNEDNMTTHHMSHPQPAQEWTTFAGKLPILQQQQQQQQEQPASGVASATLSSLSSSPNLPLASTPMSPLSSSTSATAAATAATTSSSSSNKYGDVPRTSILMELVDRVGVLHDVLRYFWKYDVNVVRIESRPLSVDGTRFDFFVDFQGTVDDISVQQLLHALNNMTSKLLILDDTAVHWFPRHVSELDLVVDRTLDAGMDLESDHPGFLDGLYRARRAELAQAAAQHAWTKEIAHIDYNDPERAVWSAVWNKMEPLWEQYACEEYLHSLEALKQNCGYGPHNIPQQRNISSFLQERTGFRMRPVTGLLSSRDFLNGLAFRVFFCTQYMRHASRPLYTPEPDLCHELLGHAPMLVDRDFADFSQTIGLASLGARDEDIDALAKCYWHSVEFGLCRENGVPKAYGAGLLSSFGELEYACNPSHPSGTTEILPPPTLLPWNPDVASKQEFPITTYQPVYFVAESLQDAKQQMRQFCQDLPRPFYALHNAQTDTIYIDRPVRRCKGIIP